MEFTVSRHATQSYLGLTLPEQGEFWGGVERVDDCRTSMSQDSSSSFATHLLHSLLGLTPPMGLVWVPGDQWTTRRPMQGKVAIMSPWMATFFSSLLDELHPQAASPVKVGVRTEAVRITMMALKKVKVNSKRMG